MQMPLQPASSQGTLNLHNQLGFLRVDLHAIVLIRIRKVCWTQRMTKRKSRSVVIFSHARWVSSANSVAARAAQLGQVLAAMSSYKRQVKSAYRYGLREQADRTPLSIRELTGVSLMHNRITWYLQPAARFQAHQIAVLQEVKPT